MSKAAGNPRYAYDPERNPFGRVLTGNPTVSIAAMVASISVRMSQSGRKSPYRMRSLSHHDFYRDRKKAGLKIP
jgi:hypothetical protein